MIFTQTLFQRNKMFSSIPRIIAKAYLTVSLSTTAAVFGLHNYENFRQNKIFCKPAPYVTLSEQIKNETIEVCNTIPDAFVSGLFFPLFFCQLYHLQNRLKSNKFITLNSPTSSEQIESNVKATIHNNSN